MSDFYPNSYQTPNALIDQLLSSGDIDTYEFTLLSVIIRQTRGWHKLEDSISISQFEKLAPVISRRTIINKLQSLKEKGLIEVKEVVFGKENAPNKYKLSSAFSAKGGSAADAQGSAADAQGSAADAPIGSAADAQGGSAADAPTKNKSLNSVNSKQQNSLDAVVSGDESPGAAIAAMKNNGIEAAKAAELVTLHGPARCLAEVDKAKFAAQKGAIRESVAAWIIGSLATPNGFSVPKGYQPPAERAKTEAANRKRAEIAQKKREAEAKAEEQNRQRIAELLEIFHTLPDDEQNDILADVLQQFERSNDFNAHLLRKWREQHTSDKLLFKQHRTILEDEFVAVMLENEQEKAG